MPNSQLEDLRKLRLRASLLLNSLTEDLNAFRHRIDNVTFRRQPGQESKPNDVGVTTTCSCLMALALGNRLETIFGKKYLDKTRESFSKVFVAPWASSGLDEN